MSDTIGIWAANRQPASFRGVGFTVLESSLRRGRQVALHEYAFRDNPWPEDIARAPRVTSFRGYIFGDDVDGHLVALIKAVEMPGPGPLIHPTIGAISAVVMDFTASDTAERGRVWSFEMTIIPWVQRQYPLSAPSTGARVGTLFGSFGAAVAKDFAAVRDTIATGVQAVQGAVMTVQSYAAQASSLVHDVTNLAHLVTGLPGNFGRFSGGALGSVFGAVGQANITVSQALGATNAALGSVDRIGASLSGLAARL